MLPFLLIFHSMKYADIPIQLGINFFGLFMVVRYKFSGKRTSAQILKNFINFGPRSSAQVILLHGAEVHSLVPKLLVANIDCPILDGIDTLTVDKLTFCIQFVIVIV